MTQHNLTQILKVIRDFVMRNRPCYRDYLGSETETKTVQIGSGTFEDNDGVVREIFPATDPEFSGFILGETYTVAIDGVAEDYMARVISPFSDEAGPIIGTITTVDMENGTFDGWFTAAGISNDAVICMAQTLDTSFVGKTISISQTKTETVTRYNTKLLPEYLLPAFLRKNVVATKTEVQSAAAKAADAADAASNAQTTANAAQTTADTAKSTADAARTTANTAQATANTAKSTADNAKIAADAAFPKTGGDITGNVKISGSVSFPETYTRSDGSPLTITGLLLNSSISSGVVRIRMCASGVDISNTDIKTIETELDGIRISNPNEIANYKTVSIQVKGEKLSFVDYYTKAPKTICAKDIILQSSTSGSNKKFLITVDDTGTLKATEVT